MKNLLWVWVTTVMFLALNNKRVCVFGVGFAGFDEFDEEYLLNVTKISSSSNSHSVSSYGNGGGAPAPLLVRLTLIQGADAKGAVCLDGTLPGYHIHRGYGAGANSWLIQLEGGGWCNTVRACVYRKTTRRGSSKFMEKELAFTGILSNKAEENPDFFNWNRVKVRYCDGASFTGDGEDKGVHSYNANVCVSGALKDISVIEVPPRWTEYLMLDIAFMTQPLFGIVSMAAYVAQLQFRGQKIWSAAMEDLMSKGMHNAEQALLSGCSAGGLASILHCDEFRDLFPSNNKVKCLSDAGMFLDAVDVSGGRSLRALFGGVVSLQGVQKNLPSTCTNHLDPTSCFFPQNLIANIKTPLFLLNAAYDSWQVQASLAPPSADPRGTWHDCKSNHALCSSSQLEFLQEFRNNMLNAIKGFSEYHQSGLFINSCFAHCQTERQDTWFADDSPLIGNKPVALAVGDWYFDRSSVKDIDCAYPCDKTCHNLVFRK